MEKTFNIVGVSRVRENAPFKFRLANGKPENRAHVLKRNGHADVFLVTLDTPLTKVDAIANFKQQYPQYADVKTKAVAVTKEKPAAELLAEVLPENEEILDAVLSPAAKLALKRARDAARKREKRAAEKAAKLAA